MANPLAKEFEFYLEHQAELAKQHDGQVVVIKNQKVIGVYGDIKTAVSETQKEHELGTFLVQQVGGGPDVHTHVFHSRVALSQPSP